MITKYKIHSQVPIVKYKHFQVINQIWFNVVNITKHRNGYLFRIAMSNYAYKDEVFRYYEGTMDLSRKCVLFSKLFSRASKNYGVYKC